MKWIYFTVILVCICLAARGQEKVQFRASDNLPVTADWYPGKQDMPALLLCHLAGLSRGEYMQTARRLNGMGYNCLALDARSGGEVMGVVNETSREAKSLGKATEFLDARVDIIAAINYLDSITGHKGVVVVGSSYSAALAILVGKNSAEVKAIAAFSPGNYFGPSIRLEDTIAVIKKPMFLTSSRDEFDQFLQPLIKQKPLSVVIYRPDKKGAHGSIALWNSSEGHEGYWNAFLRFLAENIINN